MATQNSKTSVVHVNKNIYISYGYIYFSSHKDRKVVYVKIKKPIITTEDAEEESVNQEELCNNNDKTEDKSDFFSNTNNKKRKFDVKINEEICDNFYYKLLPTMFKISKSIQRSCDYWKKSYMLGYEN
ncbi:uncharacterized protein OCT59_009795 [Rhizophagus irregularis]|uniref:uncharacterized protein n=1 Tax=Rhizophagus irregularis TaxID=588596 RepID=UPI001A02768B|nr:hypothetical protein OCT59_009795 [Rhizophagus irregularis]GBC29179.2 hypothetical protein GLOIN_2v1874914 [Rhizophagus irregularis DAOM 181602=DAOM 197198]